MAKSEVGPWRFKMRYRITLECGHSFKSSSYPLGRNQTYPCKYTPSCGYRQHWTACVDMKEDHQRG